MPSKRPIIILAAILILLAACDPVPLPYETVLQVAADGSTAYAYVQQRSTWGIGGHPPDVDYYYLSSDGGETWQQIPSAPALLEQKMDAARDRAGDNCAPDISQNCMQVNGLGELKVSYDGGQTWEASSSYWYPSTAEELDLYYRSTGSQPVCRGQECFRILNRQIEQSADGGLNWAVDWKLPPGREEYVLRHYNAYRSGETNYLYPVDLALLDTGTDPVVIAAMGGQGILVRSEEGWNAVAVGKTLPIPLTTANLNGAFRLFLDEYLLYLPIAGLVSGLLAGVSWIFLKMRLPAGGRNVLKPWSLLYAGVCITVCILFLLPFIRTMTGYFIGGIPLVCLPALLVGAALAWGAVYTSFALRRWLLPSLLVGIVYPMLVCLGLLLPYLLWSLAVVPTLGWASWIGIALGSVVTIWGLIHTWKLVSWAVAAPADETNTGREKTAGEAPSET